MAMLLGGPPSRAVPLALAVLPMAMLLLISPLASALRPAAILALPSPWASAPLPVAVLSLVLPLASAPLPVAVLLLVLPLASAPLPVAVLLLKLPMALAPLPRAVLAPSTRWRRRPSPQAVLLAKPPSSPAGFAPSPPLAHSTDQAWSDPDQSSVVRPNAATIRARRAAGHKPSKLVIFTPVTSRRPAKTGGRHRLSLQGSHVRRVTRRETLYQ